MIKFSAEKKSFTDGGLNEFIEERNVKLVDGYEEQLKELFFIRNPKFRFLTDYETELNEFLKVETKGKSYEECGEWFYFEWSNCLIHYLPEKEYLELRTARNKNLITSSEQEKYYNYRVGFAGLSVGSHGALTTAIMGGAKQVKLADPDEVSVSNLNRLRYGASVLGTNKALVAARIIAEINPYAEIDLYEEGIDENNIVDFLSGLNILVEGVDNLPMKIRLREVARETGTPVIMATDNGDSVIVDVERYDLDRELQLFNGALGDFGMEQFMNFPPTELPRLATKVAGPEYIVPRMLSSLMEVGKTLYSWPQLGSAASFSGVVTAYLLRAFAEGKNIKGGKYNVSLEDIFEPNTKSDRDQERNDILGKMNLL